MSIENKTDLELQVVPATEVKEALDAVKSDMASLRSQMESDRESTGLEIEKRADDMIKAVEHLEELSVKLERVERAQAENTFASTFGQSSGELKDALQSFGAGFLEFNGDGDAIACDVGSKPTLKHLIEGVFTKMSLDPDDDSAQFHAPRHIAIRRLQKASDQVYQVDALLRAQMDDNDRREYDRNGGVKSTKTYQAFAQIAGQFAKAAGDLIDTTTEIPDFIPTQFSANLYEQIKINLTVMGMFQEIAMAAPTVVLPLDMNDNESMRMAEVTSITNADPYADTDLVNPSAFASAKITLNAEKLRSRYWVSQEADEDAIVAMIPLLRRKHVRNMAEAIEDAGVNGQPTNLDTGGTHFGKANPLVAGGTDARDCWDGFRRFAAQYTGTPAVKVDNANAKATVVTMRGLRAAMGPYGITPQTLAYVFGLFGYIKLLDDPDVSTFEKFGPNATIRTGTLAQVDGVDVVLSRRVAENMNASGIIDGVTTDRTEAFAVNTDAAILGVRRRNTLGSQYHLASDSTEVVSFWRGDFQPIYPVASVPAFAELYNVAAS